MIKRFLIALILPVISTSAVAEGGREPKGFYIATRGYSSIEDQNNFIFENSREIAGAVGLRPYDNVRFELEFSTRWSDIAGLNGARGINGNAGVTGKSSVQTLGLHTFYDFRKGKRLRPFVGAGAGAAMLNFKFEGPADINPSFIVIGDDRDFSHYFNFFGGATYNVTQNLRLGAGIEYVTLKDDTIQSNIGGIEGINRAYNFFLSARWFFRDQ